MRTVSLLLFCCNSFSHVNVKTLKWGFINSIGKVLYKPDEKSISDLKVTNHPGIF